MNKTTAGGGGGSGGDAGGAREGGNGAGQSNGGDGELTNHRGKREVRGCDVGCDTAPPHGPAPTASTPEVYQGHTHLGAAGEGVAASTVGLVTSLGYLGAASSPARATYPQGEVVEGVAGVGSVASVPPNMAAYPIPQAGGSGGGYYYSQILNSQQSLLRPIMTAQPPLYSPLLPPPPPPPPHHQQHHPPPAGSYSIPAHASPSTGKMLQFIVFIVIYL